MEKSGILIARDFEYKVIDLITSVLSNNETIKLGPQIDKRGRVADILLEKGCNKLDYPPNTLIEIKYRLGYDMFSRILGMYHQAMNSGHYNRLVIICKDCLLDNSQIDTEEKVSVFEYRRIVDSIGDLNVYETFLKKVEENSESILDKAKERFANDKITLFIGAGASIDAKLPSWNMLLQRLLVKQGKMPFSYINEANAESISESFANSSIVAGRYIIERYSEVLRQEKPNVSEQQINEDINKVVTDRIRDALYKNIANNSSSELVKIIASVAKNKNVQQLITYNYDDLVETEIANSNSFVSVYDDSISHAEVIKPIYHVHGFIPRDKTLPGLPVLSEKEYHKLYSRMHHWANVVQLNALYTTTCFFIGFSMTDPNQRRLLDLARNVDFDSIDSDKAQHYIFLRRQRLRGEAVKEVNDEHCQEVENIMFELGLNVIWFDDFKNLPKCLSYVAGISNDKPNMNFI